MADLGNRPEFLILSSLFAAGGPKMRGNSPASDGGNAQPAPTTGLPSPAYSRLESDHRNAGE